MGLRVENFECFVGSLKNWIFRGVGVGEGGSRKNQYRGGRNLRKGEAGFGHFGDLKEGDLARKRGGVFEGKREGLIPNACYGQ